MKWTKANILKLTKMEKKNKKKDLIQNIATAKTSIKISIKTFWQDT